MRMLSRTWLSIQSFLLVHSAGKPNNRKCNASSNKHGGNCKRQDLESDRIGTRSTKNNPAKILAAKMPTSRSHFIFPARLR
jgi:hypothetical protein